MYGATSVVEDVPDTYVPHKNGKQFVAKAYKPDYADTCLPEHEHQVQKFVKEVAESAWTISSPMFMKMYEANVLFKGKRVLTMCMEKMDWTLETVVKTLPHLAYGNILFETVLQVMFQLYTLQLASGGKLTMHDLHPGNVMITSLDAPQTTEFVLTGTHRMRCHLRYKATIIDFGCSTDANGDPSPFPVNGTGTSAPNIYADVNTFLFRLSKLLREMLVPVPPNVGDLLAMADDICIDPESDEWGTFVTDNTDLLTTMVVDSIRCSAADFVAHGDERHDPDEFEIPQAGELVSKVMFQDHFFYTPFGVLCHSYIRTRLAEDKRVPIMNRCLPVLCDAVKDAFTKQKVV